LEAGRRGLIDIPSCHLPGETGESHNNLHILRFSQSCNCGCRCSGMWSDAVFRRSATPSSSGVKFRSSENFWPLKMKQIRSFETSGSDYPMTHGLIAEEKTPCKLHHNRSPGQHAKSPKKR